MRATMLSRSPIMRNEPIENRLLETGPEPKLLDDPVHPRSTAPRRVKAPRGRLFLIAAGLAALIAVLFLVGYIPHRNRQKKTDAGAQKEEETLPVANVAKVKRSASVSELMLPGNVTPLTEAYIYARASGYLKRRYVDIGDRVRAGQLLAELDSPELDQQVQQARASLAQARAQLGQTQAALGQAQSQLKLAAVTLDRWKILVGRGVLSKQEGDQKQADYENAEANVHAAEADVRASQDNIRASQANLNRLTELQAFKSVRAPFDGVITARNVDTGSLISGTGAGGPELFRIAQIGTVRIMINVPQGNAASIHLKQPADVLLQEFSKRKFPGKVTRTASSLDPATRTLLTEVQVSNADRALLPGMYAQVRFSDPRPDPPLLIPGDSLVTRADGTQVAVLLEGNKVHFQPVEVGRDYGTDVEVSNGLKGTEYVVVNPGDDIKEGVIVKPAKAKTPAAQTGPPGGKRPGGMSAPANPLPKK